MKKHSKLAFCKIVRQNLEGVFMFKKILALSLYLLSFKTAFAIGGPIPLPEPIVNLALKQFPAVTLPLGYKTQRLGFTIDKKFGDLTFSNYKVDFQADSNNQDQGGRVVITLDFKAEPKIPLTKTFIGKVKLAGKINYNQDKKSFFLVNPNVENLDFGSDAEQSGAPYQQMENWIDYTQALNAPISLLAKMMIGNNPIFTLEQCNSIQGCSIAQAIETLAGKVFLGATFDNDNAYLNFGIR